MHTFWSFFIRKTQFSILLAVSLTIFGTASVLQMPKESTPKIEMPMAVILTALPGASALDVEKLITDPIEKQLSDNLEHIKKLTSQSSNGVSKVHIEFNTDADIQESIDKLKDEVDTVQSELPDDALESRVIQVDFAKQPVMTIAISADVPRGALLDLSEKLQDELEDVPGVASVGITGVQQREIQVLANKEALAEHKLTLSDLSRAIAVQNVSLPGGSITIEQTEYPVRFSGDIATAADVSALPIAAPAGTPLTVGDVATVIDGFSEPDYVTRLSVGNSPSRNSFTVDIFKRESAQITAVTKSVSERLAELSQPGKLLDGIATATTFNRGAMLHDDLTTLTTSGAMTVLLVMSILFIAVGWREALVAGLAIPLSFLTAFIGLYYSGNSLNFVSLFALVLSTGIIVDSAIVIVEGINAHMRDDNLPRIQAALRAVNEYASPLISGTLTTIAVFIPLFSISGVTGQFIASIPLTIIFVLLASLFVALAIVPVFATLVLQHKREHSALSTLRDEKLHSLQARYRTFLNEFLSDRRNSRALNSIMAILFVVSLLLPVVHAVQVIFFPAENSEYVYVETELGGGSTLGNTDIALRKIEEQIYDTIGIRSYSIIAGQSSAFSNVFEGIRTDDKLGNILLTVDKRSGRTSKEIIDELRDKVADITDGDVTVGQLEEGPPVGAPVVVTLYGDNLAELDSSAEKVLELLRSIPGTSGVSATTKDNATEFVIDIDRRKAIRGGVTPLSVAQTINTALSGYEATNIKKLGDDIAVRVRLDFSGGGTVERAGETTVDALRYMPIAYLSAPDSSERSASLLGSFVDTRITQSRSVIRHDDSTRVAIITSRLTEDGNARKIAAELTERLSELNLPDSITVKIGGENEEVDQSFADMFVALGIGISIMLAILIIQFNSIRHTTYILMTVPLSLIGVFAGLLVMNKPLSFPSILGFIALSGVVVNNGIILIDVINRKRAERGLLSATCAGTDELKDVILDAATSRLRPVLLTAITTVIGILPLVFAAELWAPLAYAMVFGLTFATVLTLVLVPAVYFKSPGNTTDIDL